MNGDFMINEINFIENTIINNLYYLRTLRELSARIELSLPPKYTEYIEIFANFSKECEKLADKIINYANGNVPANALNSEIFVTKYTLQTEELTNKLFDYNLNTNLTKRELALKPGTPIPTEELITALNEINQKALNIANEFTTYTTNLYQLINNQEAFAFYYNSLNESIAFEMQLYISILERLINRDNLSPIYATDYEYGFNEQLKSIATFIRGECDPKNNDIFAEANNFVDEYTKLLLEYETMTITPITQKNMTESSIEITTRFKVFVENCLQKLLNKELYFISPPITKDNSLTDINFFLYNLQENIKEI